ncbi:MAG: TolC family protein [Pirellulaceae bacterium]|nr:TolC family protein [Pirellulaceae bacterium]
MRLALVCLTSFGTGLSPLECLGQFSAPPIKSAIQTQQPTAQPPNLPFRLARLPNPALTSAQLPNTQQPNAQVPNAQQPNAQQPNASGTNAPAAPQPGAVVSPAPPVNVDGDLLNTPQLTLADVTASVARSFPVIEQARLQGGVAGGDILAANGFYDHKLQGYSLSDPTGVYRNYRQSIGLARQLWWGGYLSAGYRVGRGDFEPWYKERETDKSGEYKLGLVQPLLQGRAIDPARVALFQANLRQQVVGPEIDRLVLTTALEAAAAYWSWLAIGGALEAQRELLELAEKRTKQLEDLLNAGKIKSVDLLLNEQLVAERRLLVIETQQKYRESGFKLSLYLRDEAGQPMLPADEWLPKRFPRIDNLPPGDYSADLAAAFSQRPELRIIGLEMQQVTWDLRLARNQLLPQLDLITEGSQDAGDPASSANDKSRFELEVGVQGEVPIQRRKARGKIQSTNFKLAQLQQKIRWQQDKIGFELQAARNALDQAAAGVIQAEAALRSAITTLDRFNFAFTEGKTDLVYLNILESKANEYEIKLIESQNKWFIALAQMQAALGLDPIQQSIQVSSLPPADTPTPRNLPEPVKPQP